MRRIFPILAVFLFPAGCLAYTISSDDGISISISDSGSTSGVTILGASVPVDPTVVSGFLLREVGTSLIKNSGFELDKNNDGKPDNWTLGTYWSWDGLVRHTGTHSVRVSTDSPDSSKEVNLVSDTIDASGSTTYEFTCWMKMDSCWFGERGAPSQPQAQPQILIVQLDSTGDTTQVFVPNPYYSEPHDWVQLKYTLTTLSTTVKLFILARLNKVVGQAWYDDLRLVQNLVKNPGFELDEDDTPGPDYWSLGNGWSWDDSVFHSGSRSVKVHVPLGSPGYSGRLELESKIDVEPARLYEFTCWMKMDSCWAERKENAQANIFIRQYDSLGAELGQWEVLNPYYYSPQDWAELRYLFITHPRAVRIDVYANIWDGCGTGWFDDLVFAPVEGPAVPILPWVSQDPLTEHVQMTANLDALNYSFQATYTPYPDRIEVEGKITSTSSEDRCLRLFYRLPITIQDWRWWDDARSSRTIASDSIYQNAPEMPYRSGRSLSKYPFSAVDDSDSSGLSIAVPMDWPRIFRVSYCDLHGYQISYDFGLSIETAKAPSEATFRFAIYRYDPEWGFRAGTKKYYDIYPHLFARRAEREGLWFYYTGIESVPNSQDFGLMFDETGQYNWQFDNDSLIYVFAYSEPWGKWRHICDPCNEPMPQPPDSELIDTLYADLSKSVPATVWEIADSTLACSAFARAVINCMPYEFSDDSEDTNYYFEGLWHQWGPPDERYWAQNYPTNPDTELPNPNRGKIWLTNEMRYWFNHIGNQGGHLDGMYFDSITLFWGWFIMENYRRSHWHYADLPLVFSYRTKVPVMLGAFSNYEFLKAASDSLHRTLNSAGDSLLAMANIFTYSYGFYAHLLDVLGSEIWAPEPDECSIYRRTFSYQKPNSLFYQSPGTDPGDSISQAEMDHYMKRCMACGIYPGIHRAWWNGDSYWKPHPPDTLYQRDRGLFQSYIPIINSLTTAGWEPVTYAYTTVTSGSAPYVERFGYAPDNNLHFTTRNDSPGWVMYTLTVHARELGIERSSVITVTELISNTTFSVTWDAQGNTFSWSAEIDGEDTQVFRLTIQH